MKIKSDEMKIKKKGKGRLSVFSMEVKETIKARQK